MKVARKTKNRGGKTAEYHCSSLGCDKPIVAGESYYEWCFFRQRPTRQHADHGYPRQSQLTQSKLGEVYSEIESLEDTLVGEWEHSDLKDGLDNIASTAHDIADEYRDAAESFGGQGEHAERADEVEDFANNIESLDLDEYDAEGEESEEDWRERIKSEVEEALGEAP